MILAAPVFIERFSFIINIISITFVVNTKYKFTINCNLQIVVCRQRKNKK